MGVKSIQGGKEVSCWLPPLLCCPHSTSPPLPLASASLCGESVQQKEPTLPKTANGLLPLGLLESAPHRANELWDDMVWAAGGKKMIL